MFLNISTNRCYFEILPKILKNFPQISVKSSRICQNFIWFFSLKFLDDFMKILFRICASCTYNFRLHLWKTVFDYGCYWFFCSRRSPRGGKLQFCEGNSSDGSRTSGMSGGSNNDSNNKANLSSSTGAGNATSDSTATSSTSTAANTTISHVSLRANPFENFSVAMETDRKF